MEYIVKEIPVSYEQVGDGIPILMIHSWTDDRRIMKNLFEPLFESRPGWKRIYPDLPGMGRTPAPDWITSHDQLLDILLGFAEAVIPDEPFALAGVSYGGLMAQGMIHQIGKRLLGAALVVPVLDVKQAVKEVPEKSCLFRDDQMLSELDEEELDRLEGLATVHSREVLELMRTNVVETDKLADQDFLDRMPDFEFSFDANNLSLPFDKPVLLAAGRQDALIGYNVGWKVLSNFPRASYVVLDRAGHLLLFEQAAVLRVLLEEWLDRVEESAR